MASQAELVYQVQISCLLGLYRVLSIIPLQLLQGRVKDPNSSQKSSLQYILQRNQMNPKIWREVGSSQAGAHVTFPRGDFSRNFLISLLLKSAQSVFLVSFQVFTLLLHEKDLEQSPWCAFKQVLEQDFSDSKVQQSNQKTLPTLAMLMDICVCHHRHGGIFIFCYHCGKQPRNYI